MMHSSMILTGRVRQAYEK